MWTILTISGRGLGTRGKGSYFSAGKDDRYVMSILLDESADEACPIKSMVRLEIWAPILEPPLDACFEKRVRLLYRGILGVLNPKPSTKRPIISEKPIGERDEQPLEKQRTTNEAC